MVGTKPTEVDALSDLRMERIDSMVRWVTTDALDLMLAATADDIQGDGGPSLDRLVCISVSPAVASSRTGRYLWPWRAGQNPMSTDTELKSTVVRAYSLGVYSDSTWRLSIPKSFWTEQG